MPGEAINLNLAGGQNWELIWSTQRVARPVPNKPNATYAIGDIQCPILLHDPIIAISCNGSGTPITRRHWAQVIYRFRLGISIGGISESQSPDFYRAWVGGVTPFVFPRWASDYELTVRVPYWYADFRLFIFRFTGEISDEYLAGINEIKSDIATLQSDFDAHFGI